MRLWSLHPSYLDSKGLVALWREALLAQAVISGKTRGYKSHPQLIRFVDSSAPREYLANYLRGIHTEANARGYCFDAKKIGRSGILPPLSVTKGQLEYEWTHLKGKLRGRAPHLLKQIQAVDYPKPHPLFKVTRGGVADWEVVP